MWSKTSSILAPSLRLCKRNRLGNNARTLASRSYLHRPGSEPLQYVTVGDMLQRSVDRYPSRVALNSVHEQLTLTYQQMIEQADAFGCALRTQGLEKGDRLGIWAHNTLSSVVALIGALRVGVIPVQINPAYEKSELSFCIRKAGLKGLFISEKLPDKDYYSMLTDLIPELRLSKQGELQTSIFPSLKSVIADSKEKVKGVFTYDSLIKSSTNEVSKYGAEVSPDDGSIIHFTSGTTGTPKAALDTHFGVVNNVYYAGKRNGFHEGHHHICVQVPIFHALGSVVTVLSALRHGASLVLAAPTYSARANLHAIVAHKCTGITGTPTMYVDLLSLVRQSTAEVTSLRMLLTAGAPCSPQLIRDMQNELKVQSVKCLYGMTEATASVFQSMPNDSIETIAETVGYIQDHLEVKVVDNSGALVPFGSPGEAMVRGYSTMLGYWDDHEKTREVLGTDGWLSTGDRLVLTEDGYGRIVGRIKDIIVRGGENIAPKEIEDHLNTHPDILESQIIGVSDERLGEELCAVLRLKEGANITIEDLTAHCSGRLAKFKIPRILRTTEEFPKTSSGKIQKFKLKELVESGKL